MERWVLYAMASMVFAGVTSVFAKHGLEGVSAELGLAVRTCFVFCLVMLFAAAVVPRNELALLTRNNLAWLALSAVTTTASWVFY